MSTGSDSRTAGEGETVALASRAILHLTLCFHAITAGVDMVLGNDVPFDDLYNVSKA